MSKVKIQGNASGTGTLTISAPNTNTDRSLTLPDGAGEILLSDGDGSNLTGITTGKVLQIVTASQSTQTSITSTSYVDTGLSASITPSSSSSKVLVLVSQALLVSRENKAIAARMKILRGSTAIVTHTNALSIAAGLNTDGNISTASPWAVSYLDSPSTTSATTYKTQVANGESTNAASVLTEPYSNTSTITLLEIAG